MVDFALIEPLEQALSGFAPEFRTQLHAALERRLGVRAQAIAGFNDAVWKFLNVSQMPFERFFFDWYGGMASAQRAQASPAVGFYETDDFAQVRAHLAACESTDKPDHPYFSLPAPCTMLVEEVEALWAPVAERDDWSPLAEKLSDIVRMQEAYTSPL